MLHLAKLAVGIRDFAHLHEVQTLRAAQSPPLRHITRNYPRRAAEVLASGSIYWVIAGSMLARQRILDIVAERGNAGPQAALILDPVLVALVGRPTKPFQGWRYLEAAAAPPDLPDTAAARGAEALPPGLRRDLQALGLL